MLARWSLLVLAPYLVVPLVSFVLTLPSLLLWYVLGRGDNGSELSNAQFGWGRVLSFGSRYDYTHRRLDVAEDLPDWILPVTDRVERFAALRPGSIRQVLKERYPDAEISVAEPKKPLLARLGIGAPAAALLDAVAERTAWSRFGL